MLKNISGNLQIFFICIFLVLCVGCSSSPDVKGRNFEPFSMMKTDIDLVAESHQQVVFSAMQELAIKLYKRNPKEWKKEGFSSIENAVEAITSDPFPRIEGKLSIDCIRLAFDEKFQGDRVKAFIVGLGTMVLAAYDDHRAFYMHNMLEAQKLYDSARNIELAAWLLRTKYKKNGELFLVSSGHSGEINFSFERLFGKMINAQDMIAQISADRNHRQIKYILQTVATAFIPI